MCKNFKLCKFAADRFIELADPKSTILDLGCGKGHFTRYFCNRDFLVTPLDHQHMNVPGQVISEYEKIQLEAFDNIWACAVLEHQLNVNNFLRKVHSELKEGGMLCLVVPRIKQKIVGGHVTLWNAGLLLYNTILAGFDCSEARIRRAGPRLAFIVRKRSVELPNLRYDRGDIETLAGFFPPGCRHQGFDGDIKTLNWR